MASYVLYNNAYRMTGYRFILFQNLIIVTHKNKQWWKKQKYSEVNKRIDKWTQRDRQIEPEKKGERLIANVEKKLQQKSGCN